MKYVIIRMLDDEEPRVIGVGEEQEMKSKMFEILMKSEDGIYRHESDYGYCVGVGEFVNGELLTVKYLLQVVG